MTNKESKVIDQDKINLVNKFVCNACSPLQAGHRVYPLPLYKANITGVKVEQSFETQSIDSKGGTRPSLIRLFDAVPYPEKTYGFTSLQYRGRDLSGGTFEYKGSRWLYEMHKIEHDGQSAFIAEMVKQVPL